MNYLLLVGAILLIGCGAQPLSPLQKEVLVQRIRDLGEADKTALMKERARLKQEGKLNASADAFIQSQLDEAESETASLCSDVAASLR